MSVVTTSIDSITGGVKILWSAATSNNDPITSYKIEILDWTSSVWS